MQIQTARDFSTVYSAFVKFEESLISMLTGQPDEDEDAEDDDYDDTGLAKRLNKILKIEVSLFLNWL